MQSSWLTLYGIHRFQRDGVKNVLNAYKFPFFHVIAKRTYSLRFRKKDPGKCFMMKLKACMRVQV